MKDRRQFNQEVKRNAVSMVLEKGILVKKVARDLDIHPNLLQLSEDLTATAFKQAVTRERPPAGLIHHSDRGRQYACYGYQALLRRYGI